jgi:uncharacterized protein (TIGR00106 family)
MKPRTHAQKETDMHVIAEFSVIPIGIGVSLSKYVAECEKILSASGLTYELHANGTNVEGEWDDVMQAIKRCHETLHEMGVPRLSTIVKIGTRTDRSQHMGEKVQSVKRVLGTVCTHFANRIKSCWSFLDKKRQNLQ